MMQNQRIIYISGFIVYLNCLCSDIRAFQHRDTLKSFLSLRFILVLFQMFCVCCYLLYRLSRQRCIIGSKLFFQFFVSLCSKAAFWIDYHD